MHQCFKILKIQPFFAKIRQKQPGFDFFLNISIDLNSVGCCASFDMHINMCASLFQNPKNSAIFCKKWLIFRVAQGLRGGMNRIPVTEGLEMRFQQKNIMQTDLQG